MKNTNMKISNGISQLRFIVCLMLIGQQIQASAQEDQREVAIKPFQHCEWLFKQDAEKRALQEAQVCPECGAITQVTGNSVVQNIKETEKTN